MSARVHTSPKRAKPTCEVYPHFRFNINVRAGEFLIGLTGSFGPVIAPYLGVGLGLNDQQVARILGMMDRQYHRSFFAFPLDE